MRVNIERDSNISQKTNNLVISFFKILQKQYMEGFFRTYFASINIFNFSAINFFLLIFKEYAARLVNKPRIREGQEHVKQPDDRDSKCECDRKIIKSKKKDKVKTSETQV